MKRDLKRKLIIKGKSLKISARFTDKGYSKSVGFNRKLVCDKVKKEKSFIKGKINSWDYIKECSEIIGLLSPFGWGEICYRDFEAILNKCLLIKPDMDHIETWPNIYKKNMYKKLDWEFSNLSYSKTYISKYKKYIFLKILNSRNSYLEALNECSSRAEYLLDKVLNK